MRDQSGKRQANPIQSLLGRHRPRPVGRPPLSPHPGSLFSLRGIPLSGLAASQGQRPERHLRPIASLIPVRTPDALVESMTLPPLRQRGRVSDEAIVLAMRVIVVLVYLVFVPWVIWRLFL